MIFILSSISIILLLQSNANVNVYAFAPAHHGYRYEYGNGYATSTSTSHRESVLGVGPLHMSTRSNRNNNKSKKSRPKRVPPGKIIADRILYRLASPEADPDGDSTSIISPYSIEECQYYEMTKKRTLEPLGSKSIIIRGLTPGTGMRGEDTESEIKVGPALYTLKGMYEDEELVESKVVSGYVSALYCMEHPEIIQGKGLEVGSGEGAGGLLSIISSALSTGIRPTLGDIGIGLGPNSSLMAPVPSKLQKIVMTDPHPASLQHCIQNLQSCNFPPENVDLAALKLDGHAGGKNIPEGLRDEFNFILGCDVEGSASGDGNTSGESMASLIAHALKCSPRNGEGQDIKGSFLHVGPSRTSSLQNINSLAQNLVQGYRMNASFEEITLERIELTPLIRDSLELAVAHIEDEVIGDSYIEYQKVNTGRFHLLNAYHDKDYDGRNGGSFFPALEGYSVEESVSEEEVMGVVEEDIDARAEEQARILAEEEEAVRIAAEEEAQILAAEAEEEEAQLQSLAEEEAERNRNISEEEEQARQRVMAEARQAAADAAKEEERLRAAAQAEAERAMELEEERKAVEVAEEEARILANQAMEEEARIQALAAEEAKLMAEKEAATIAAAEEKARIEATLAAEAQAHASSSAVEEAAMAAKAASTLSIGEEALDMIEYEAQEKTEMEARIIAEAGVVTMTEREARMNAEVDAEATVSANMNLSVPLEMVVPEASQEEEDRLTEQNANARVEEEWAAAQSRAEAEAIRKAEQDAERQGELTTSGSGMNVNVNISTNNGAASYMDVIGGGAALGKAAPPLKEVRSGVGGPSSYLDQMSAGGAGATYVAPAPPVASGSPPSAIETPVSGGASYMSQLGGGATSLGKAAPPINTAAVGSGTSSSYLDQMSGSSAKPAFIAPESIAKTTETTSTAGATNSSTESTSVTTGTSYLNQLSVGGGGVALGKMAPPSKTSFEGGMKSYLDNLTSGGTCGSSYNNYNDSSVVDVAVATVPLEIDDVALDGFLSSRSSYFDSTSSASTYYGKYLKQQIIKNNNNKNTKQAKGTLKPHESTGANVNEMRKIQSSESVVDEAKFEVEVEAIVEEVVESYCEEVSARIAEETVEEVQKTIDEI